MKIFENYNRAKQIYGENLAQEAINNGIPDKYIFSACKFHTEDSVPFQNLLLLFKQWVTYVGNKDTIDINQLDYSAFVKIIDKSKQATLSVGEIYNDGVVSVRRITDFEQMKQLPFANLWCIRRAKWWKKYKDNEPPAEFLLITNKNYTEDSKCMYVMVEMYSDGSIGYWSTDNELIDDVGSTGRLPKLEEYKTTLGNALAIINKEQNNITNNKGTTKCNENMKTTRKKIRLSEEQLKNLIRESIVNVLSENEAVNEGWGKNLAMAGLMGAASIMPNNANAQNINAQNIEPDSIEYAQPKKYTSKDIRNINMQIGNAESEVGNGEEVRKLKNARDKMVDTFSQEEKTVHFKEPLKKVIETLEICGWCSKYDSEYTEEGTIETWVFEAFNNAFIGNNELSKGQSYLIIFNNGLLSKIKVHENYGEIMKKKIDSLGRDVKSVLSGRYTTNASKEPPKPKRRNFGDDMYF